MAENLSPHLVLSRDGLAATDRPTVPMERHIGPRGSPRRHRLADGVRPSQTPGALGVPVGDWAVIRVGLPNTPSVGVHPLVEYENPMYENKKVAKRRISYS